MRADDTISVLLKWIGTGPRTFGQVLISRIPDRVELRHIEDAGRGDLELIADCEAARSLANFDDAGKYRPLKTAPNLRRGWRMEFQYGAEVFHALGYFYPAMAGVWHAHCDGELNPVHLRETLGRQTGMYRVTQNLTDGQAQQVIAQTCCASACMKTILWRIDSRQPITSLPADKFSPSSDPAVMPLLCHEACNILVAAARRVVKGEAA
jgi:sirohydrochlorin cobaltochelatase